MGHQSALDDLWPGPCAARHHPGPVGHPGPRAGAAPGRHSCSCTPPPAAARSGSIRSRRSPPPAIAWSPTIAAATDGRRSRRPDRSRPRPTTSMCCSPRSASIARSWLARRPGGSSLPTSRSPSAHARPRDREQPRRGAGSRVSRARPTAAATGLNPRHAQRGARPRRARTRQPTRVVLLATRPPSDPVDVDGTVPSGVPATSAGENAAASSTPTGRDEDTNGRGRSASDIQAVTQVVAAYARAHEDRSAATVKALHPSLTIAELAALDRTFAESSNYRFGVSQVGVTLNGDRARVTCTVTRVLSVGAESRTLARRGVFDLDRTESGSWNVARFRLAP